MAHEELIQRDLLNNPESILDWKYYNIGATNIKTLKNANIIDRVDYNSIEKNFNLRKPDALLVKNKRVFAVIEYKDPRAFVDNASKEKAIKQNLDVSFPLGATLAIVTDGHETIWINAQSAEVIRDSDGNTIQLNWNKNDDRVLQLLLDIESMISKDNSKLFPANEVDPSPLARQVWQAVWAVSGATPENALYTFVEFFIFKYLSDLGILKGRYSFESLLELYKEETDEDVLEYYATNIRKKIKEIFPENPKDKTTIINGTIFISKDDKAIKGYGTVFKNVLMMFKKFGKLENIHHDFKSKLFESFLKESISKKQWGQFFTPLKIVKPLVKMADIKPGMKIIDPASGVGKFVLEAILPKLDDYYEVDNNGQLVENVHIEGFDKGFDREEQKTIILAKANMLIYFSDLLKTNRSLLEQKDNPFGKLFNKTFTLKTNSILGTLADPKNEEYDLILTNPPYVVSGSTNLKEEIAKDIELSDYYKISATGIEGLFMEWIIRSLKKRGQAFVVIPDGMLLRKTDSKLRKFILDETNVDAIISLPVNAFFSTAKKTYIIAMTKKNKKIVNDYEVFTYIVNDIGETLDVNRFDTGKNELDDASIEFKKFKIDPNSYESNVINFKKINSKWLYDNIESGWQIENNWSIDEQIMLGIKEQEKLLTPSEFALFIGEVSNELKTFQVEMEAIENELLKKKVKFEKVEIKNFFNIKRGNGLYTKKYIHNNKGDIPVYSGGAFEKIGFVDNYNGTPNTLSWSIDGLAGYIMAHYSHYAATNHRGILEPLSNNISIDYARPVLQRMFRSEKRGRLAKGGKNEYTALPPNRIKNMKFPIPVDNDGVPDLITQEILAKKYLIVEEMNEFIDQKISDLKSSTLYIENTSLKYKKIRLDDIIDFNLIQTNGSSFTKKFINNHKGEIPVYGASQFMDEVSYGYIADNIEGVKYFEDIVTWNIDGSIKAFNRKGKFSLSEKVLPIYIKEQYKDDIDKDFLVREMNKLVITNNFSRFNKPGKGKLKKSYINIPIEKGEYSIRHQLMIEAQYKIFEQTMNAFVEKLKQLKKIKVV